MYLGKVYTKYRGIKLYYYFQPQRLEEEKCAKKDLIEMLMEDD